MERLQKVLAMAGIASRRKCEEIILAGRVMVNDKIVRKLGAKVDPLKDKIKVDGKPVRLESKVYVMFNKPKGVISSVSDPFGRKVVTDFLKDFKTRLYPIGRLDYDTEGLILLTNDGEFANLLMHPKYHIPRTYVATVQGIPHGTVLEQLKNGIMLEDGMTAPAEVEYKDVDEEKNRSEIIITLYEGRNRQVRRMFEKVNHPVLKLKRVQYGPLRLEGLPRGKYRLLSDEEVQMLKNAALSHTKFKKTDQSHL